MATRTSSARSAGEDAAAEEALAGGLLVDPASTPVLVLVLVRLESPPPAEAVRAAESALATLSSSRGPIARATRTVCSGHSSRNAEVSSTWFRESGEEAVAVQEQASLMAWRWAASGSSRARAWAKRRASWCMLLI